MTKPATTQRKAVRALMLADRRLLLMQMHFPWLPDPMWIAPGGGLRAHETLEDGLRRELREETGKSDVQIGAVVWEREFEIRAPGQTTRQHETFFLVRTGWFVPVPTRLEPLERRAFGGFRWWPLDDLPGTRSIEAGETLYAVLEPLCSKQGG
jgi:ADP-ribose pyrophosphatase YjhB (NUDIX family)